MADSEHTDRPRQAALYPEPTIVIGIGRFGLSVLERLGDDWRWLSYAAGGDTSLKNLRLLSLRSDPTVDDERWRRPESALARVAHAAGEDDLPTLTLRFAILRALGLIRYRDGAYQLAIPKDAGAVETGLHHDTRRRRYFEWLSLDSDPRRAVERLHRLAERISEVDFFLTPIVERVLHGQSPRILLHLISRCRAYLDGRDPSPWDWIQPHFALKPDLAHSASPTVVPFDPDWHTDDDRLHLLDGLVPSPLPPGPDDALPPIVIPAPFRPVAGDLPTPLSPKRLLRIDWETSGWVAEEIDHIETVEFDPLNSSLFRLGFFDHDVSSGFDTPRMSEALNELGQLLHRGLLRMWLDLQRDRDEDLQISSMQRRRHGAEASAEQCLEILGELVIRPLVSGNTETPVLRPSARSDRWVDGPPLSDQPSHLLLDAIVDTESPESMPERPLLERFNELGLHFDAEDLGQRPLFRQLHLHPRDLDDEARLTDLRSIINEETRHLISFDHLKTYRKRPSRQPPRLTIFVVAEAKEAFARRTLRPVLRAIHQELIRAYGPIFNTSRDGFDRALSIVPLVWTPHPADAFGGDHPDANRVEEASILEAVHELRRWVEALPANRRCIPQIYINSRVTDSSVLGLDDAIDQTRDFLSFQIRNDLGKDPWLRQTAEGFGSGDLFSTFTCLQIDFPAERAREYLANRLAREALRRLIEPGRDDPTALEDDELLSIAPPPKELLEPPEKRLSQETSRAADHLTSSVDDRLDLRPETTTAQIINAFDESFEDELYQQVHQAWTHLTRNRGAMDSMIALLRQSSADHLKKTIVNSRTSADNLIEQHAAKGGLKAARAGFARLHDSSRAILDDSEIQRRHCQNLCLTHDIPNPQPIARARNHVVQAGLHKPDKLPMILGLILWAVMTPTLGAPLPHSLARALNLHESIGPIEVLLGPLGWLSGGLLLFVPVVFLLRHHMQERLRAVRQAVADLSDAVRDVVEGSDTGLFASSPSIRSFIAARLRLTAALAGRNFADRIHDRIDQDRALAYRLVQSLDVQQRRLRQRAETLGVRPTSNDNHSGRVDDDVRAIFHTNSSEHGLTLLSPDLLIEHYRRHFPTERDIDSILPRLLDRAGGFARWREEACLSDTEALLDFGRHKFLHIVTTPAGAQPAFEDEVGQNLARFIARHYANIGFGARFIGYEGFDTTGLRQLADTALLLHPRLRPAFEKARRAPDAPPTTETLNVIEAPILPNTAFVLSLVQGIHARSVHNLRRHETFFDRLELPDAAAPWRLDTITTAGRHRDHNNHNNHNNHNHNEEPS